MPKELERELVRAPGCSVRRRRTLAAALPARGWRASPVDPGGGDKATWPAPWVIGRRDQFRQMISCIQNTFEK
jgi:hypothetical protein